MNLLDLPVPFQSLFGSWKSQGMTWQNPKWTSDLLRHFCACVYMPDGRKCFAKMAMANQPDQDEPTMRDGLRREVWWSCIIECLGAKDPHFPFVSPRVIDHNTDDEEAEVSWILFEFESAIPVMELRMSEGLFQKALNRIVVATSALDHLQQSTLQRYGMPSCPELPHDSRRYHNSNQLDMKTACLGNGAWELKNFYLRPDFTLVVMDNEFAGWYPPHDQLTYLYHRLYCNDMQPDLAKAVLRKYLEVKEDEFRGSDECVALLKSRVWRGFLADLVRRRIMPWHRKQRLRMKLWWHLWRRHDIKLRY